MNLYSVEATEEQLADLRDRLENDPEMDSAGLAEYAVSVGITPPEGTPAYSIVGAYPDDEDEDMVLSWMGYDESAQGDDQ